jgi:hypothetical protein
MLGRVGKRPWLSSDGNPVLVAGVITITMEAGTYMLLLNINNTTYGDYATNPGIDNDWWSRFPYEATFSGLRRQLYDPMPPYKSAGTKYDFAGVGWWVEGLYDVLLDVTWPQNLIINGNPDSGMSRPAFIPSVQAKRSLLGTLFGIGNGLYGKVPGVRIGNSTGPGQGADDTNGAICGFKYGIYNTLEESPLAYFRRDSFGQFRDMMEQRPDSRFLAARFGRRYTSGGPVRCRFVSSEGRLIDPSRTASSNLDMFASSSLPYFDDTTRNRGPLDVPSLAMSSVSI